MTRILVTGAGGFLGSHLAERLLAEGHSVRALARPTNVPHWLRDRGAELLLGDVTDPTSQVAAIRGRDVIFHAASLVTEVSAPDSEYQRVNAEASADLARRAAEAGARRFVFISSTSVHPPNTGKALDEQSPREPQDAYGRSKAEAEDRLHRVSAETGLPLVVVRPSRIYGPRDRSLVRVFRAIAHRRFLLVGPCTAEVDFVFVSDVVEAVLRAASHGIGTYLVGGPEKIAIGRFFQEVAVALGTRLPTIRLPERPIVAASWLIARLWMAFGREPPVAPKRIAFFNNSRVVDNRRACADLGYSPEVVVRDGIRRTADWYRQAGWL